MVEDGIIIVRIPKRFGIRRNQGFMFNMRMWAYMLDYTQLSFDEFGTLGERYVRVLFYCGAYTYDMWHGKKPKYTEDNVATWIDDMPQKTAQKILDVFLKSKVGGESLIDLIQVSEGKKKK
jgi:hypothetical protein